MPEAGPHGQHRREHPEIDEQQRVGYRQAGMPLLQCLVKTDDVGCGHGGVADFNRVALCHAVEDSGRRTACQFGLEPCPLCLEPRTLNLAKVSRRGTPLGR